MDPIRHADFKAVSTPPVDLYTLAFWAAFKKAGYVRARYVGLLQSVDIPVRISRVTTRSVFVRILGHVEAMHPDDLRPVDPSAISEMRRQGLI